MNPRPLGGTRPARIECTVWRAVLREASTSPKLIASIAAASSQAAPEARPSTLSPIVPSGARRLARIASRDFAPAARYADAVVESPIAVARFAAAQRPLAAVIVVYAKCFCLPFQC